MLVHLWLDLCRKRNNNTQGIRHMYIRQAKGVRIYMAGRVFKKRNEKNCSIKKWNGFAHSLLFLKVLRGFVCVYRTQIHFKYYFVEGILSLNNNESIHTQYIKKHVSLIWFYCVCVWLCARVWCTSANNKKNVPYTNTAWLWKKKQKERISIKKFSYQLFILFFLLLLGVGMSGVCGMSEWNYHFCSLYCCCCSCCCCSLSLVRRWCIAMLVRVCTK